MAFSLACDAGKTTLRIEGEDNNVTWSDVANAGAGSVAVDGGGTEDPSFFVTEHIANAIYQILKSIQYGDGTNALTFYSKKETVYFDNNLIFTIKDNAVLQLGEIVGGYCINGSYWSWAKGTTIIASGDSGATCKVYGSTVLFRGGGPVGFIIFAGGVVDFRNSIFSSVVQTAGMRFLSTFDSLTLKDLYIANWQYWWIDKTPNTIESVWMHYPESGLYAYASASVQDLLVTDDVTSKIRLGTEEDITLELINPRWIPVQADIIISLVSGIVMCKYTCDIHVVDKDGANLQSVTVLCEDKDSNQIFSVQTGADGKIAQQAITYKKWEGTAETETEYSPHKFTFSKNSYTLLVMENVTVDARINWDIEVKFPERIRARMANLGRLAILR